MQDYEERTIAGLTVRIDRLLCVGFEDCVACAPRVFRMDEDGIVVFTDEAASADAGDVLAACRICPVDALSATDASGRQVAP